MSLPYDGAWDGLSRGYRSSVKILHLSAPRPLSREPDQTTHPSFGPPHFQRGRRIRFRKPRAGPAWNPIYFSGDESGPPRKRR